MKIVTEFDPISICELRDMSKNMYDSLVKAVIDVENKIMVVDAELHVDEETCLLEKGSDQKNLWGINLYPDKFGGIDWIEFDSMINLRPSQGNRTRSVESLDIQHKIIIIVGGLVK